MKQSPLSFNSVLNPFHGHLCSEVYGGVQKLCEHLFAHVRWQSFLVKKDHELALATLGDTTQMESFLSVSHHPSLSRQVQLDCHVSLSLGSLR